MSGVLHLILEWLQDSIKWITISLAAGTLFALRRGAVGLRSWLAVLVKSCLVGVLAGPVIAETNWSPGEQALAIAGIAFGADSVLYLVDHFWLSATRNPAGLAQRLLRIIGWAPKSERGSGKSGDWGKEDSDSEGDPR